MLKPASSPPAGPGRAPELEPSAPEPAAGVETPAARVFDTVVAPGGALLAINIMMFAGLTSFSIRPAMNERMLPMMGMTFAGIALGALAFPRLAAWADAAPSAAARRLRLIPVAAYLLASLATVLPGFFHYAHNETLRTAANFVMGLIVVSGYHLFFSRFPDRRRGLCFGGAIAGGVVCWRVLVLLAQCWNGDIHPHPFLPWVFLVHLAAMSCLTALTLAAFVFRRRAPAPPWEPRFIVAPIMTAERRSAVRHILAAVLLLQLMNSLLDIRLFPMPALPQPAIAPAAYALLVVCLPLAGWLLDRWPEMVYRKVLPACCVLFILAPSLAALGAERGLRDMLEALVGAGQFAVFVVFTVSLAGLVPDAKRATLYACLPSIMWMLPVLFYLVTLRGLRLGGVAVLLSTILAYMLFRTMRRVDFVIAGPDGGDFVPPATRTEHTSGPGMVAFLESVGLTPRERETAELLIKGSSYRGIALELRISESTVKKHAASAFSKFGVLYVDSQRERNDGK